MTPETRVAVVTGSGQGIGKAIAEQLAEDGYAVVIADFNGDTAETTAAELRKQGFKVVSVQGDVSKPEAHQHFVQTAVAEFGRLDTYVNNAGIAQIKLLKDQTPAEMQQIFAVSGPIFQADYDGPGRNPAGCCQLRFLFSLTEGRLHDRASRPNRRGIQFI